MGARRAEIARAAGKDPGREACFRIAVELKAKGATFAAVRKALLEHEDHDVATWAGDNSEETLHRLYDSASPEKPLPVTTSSHIWWRRSSSTCRPATFGPRAASTRACRPARSWTT